MSQKTEQPRPVGELIESCDECQHAGMTTVFTTHHICLISENPDEVPTHLNRVIPDFPQIPDWCPLMEEQEKPRPVGELITEFAELRDHLKMERKKFKELENGLKHDMEMLEASILEKQRELGLTSLSTESLTAFQTEKKYVRVGHWDTFINFIIESKNTQCLEKRCAKLACLELFEEGTVPADIGLERETEICVQIRKK